MRRWLLLVLKIGISAALLYWAMRGVHIESVVSHFSRFEPLWIAAAAGILGIQIVAGAMRWSAIASRLGVPIRFGRACRVSAIAAFLNQTLPSTVGGDAMRVWALGRMHRDWKSAIYSVLVDRIAGVAFLAALVAACLPWSMEMIQAPAGRAAVLAIGLGGIASLPVLLLMSAVPANAGIAAWKPTRLAFEIARAARRTVLARDRIGLIAGLSVFVHLLTVASALLLARAVALTPDLLKFLILIPPVILISMVPVSIGGWGIREGAMVLAFSYAGLPPSEALAVSVLMGGVGLLVGAVGGLLWISERGAGLRSQVPAAPREAAAGGRETRG